MTFTAAARAHFAAAAQLLGWTPDAFWAATPDEYCAALGCAVPDGAMADGGVDRARLEALMRRFPDTRTTGDG